MTVAATGDSVKDLRRAKETALALSRELEDELTPKVASEETDGVPF